MTFKFLGGPRDGAEIELPDRHVTFLFEGPVGTAVYRRDGASGVMRHVRTEPNPAGRGGGACKPRGRPGRTGPGDGR